MICWSLGGNVSHAHATVAVKECGHLFDVDKREVQELQKTRITAICSELSRASQAQI